MTLSGYCYHLFVWIIFCLGEVRFLSDSVTALIVSKTDGHPFRVVLVRAYRGLTGGFLLLRNFSVAISVSPHVCFILVQILISMFLR